MFVQAAGVTYLENPSLFIHGKAPADQVIIQSFNPIPAPSQNGHVPHDSTYSQTVILLDRAQNHLSCTTGACQALLQNEIKWLYGVQSKQWTCSGSVASFILMCN